MRDEEIYRICWLEFDRAEKSGRRIAIELGTIFPVDKPIPWPRSEA